jgi:hypothetical protein
MASPEAADLVRHGRLTADLTPSGFVAVADEPEAPAVPGAGPATTDGDGDRAVAVEDDAAARRARRAAVAARDDARKRARLAADQAVLATRHAEREAGRARATAAAAIEAASAARERATRAARDLREAEDRIPPATDTGAR